MLALYPPNHHTNSNLHHLQGFNAPVRPDLVPGVSHYLYGSQYPGDKAINPAAFVDPPLDPSTQNPLRNGNLSRNYFRGFGAAQWDFAVHRNFPIYERLGLQFRAELFNLLNHPQLRPPRKLIRLFRIRPFQPDPFAKSQQQ